ncbi:trypsin-like serine peptidase [Gordonia polyisoprenivorans]|uniref:trypsin-like serine peptidase n=1 Tax=Gordonia polyisoprenivorans TaxID=84595 RepID=UPI0023016B45|nr:serine protease [Gordonia polyisoprenivorans]WCB39477.1 serine protease [Gordonia polyisoprenivorans]
MLTPARLVQIVVVQTDGNQRYGTGYRISDEHVLTARHVVVDGQQIDVRIFHDGTHRRTVSAAPTPVIVSGDIALLVLLDIGVTSAVGPKTTFGSLDRNANSYHVRTAGFPAFAFDDSAGNRDVWAMTGTVQPLSGSRNGHLFVQFTDTDVAAQREHNSPWAGMSGAPVWVGDTLAGVITDDRTAVLPKTLLAQRLDSLIELLQGVYPSTVVQVAGLYEDSIDDVKSRLPDGGLRDRSDELSLMAEHCLSANGVLLFVAPEQYGKTALMRHFATHAPEHVTVLHFFVSDQPNRLRHSANFYETMLDQVESLTQHQSLHWGRDPRLSLRRALSILAAAESERNRRVVVLVDDVDADVHYKFDVDSPDLSIVQTLPTTEIDGLSYIVTTRGYDRVEADLIDSELLAASPRHLLSKSPYATVNQRQAHTELLRALGHAGTAGTIVGLLVASGRSITVRDIASIAQDSSSRIEGVCRSELRLVVRLLGDDAASREVAFVGTAIRKFAGEAMGLAETRRFRGNLQGWIDRSIESAGWSDLTPDFLCADYPALLYGEGDLTRLVELVRDSSRRRWLIAAGHQEQVMLQAKLCHSLNSASQRPDLSTGISAAISWIDLEEARLATPPDALGLMVRLRQTGAAKTVAATLVSDVDRSVALSSICRALALESATSEALEVCATIPSDYIRHGTMVSIAALLAPEFPELSQILLYDAVESGDPGDSLTRLTVARICVATGFTQRAPTTIASLLDQLADDAVSGATPPQDVCLTAAVVALACSDFGLAERALALATRGDDWFHIYAECARTLEKIGHPEVASEIAARVIERHDDIGLPADPIAEDPSAAVSIDRVLSDALDISERRMALADSSATLRQSGLLTSRVLASRIAYILSSVTSPAQAAQLLRSESIARRDSEWLSDVTFRAISLLKARRGGSAEIDPIIQYLVSNEELVNRDPKLRSTRIEDLAVQLSELGEPEAIFALIPRSALITRHGRQIQRTLKIFRKCHRLVADGHYDDALAESIKLPEKLDRRVMEIVVVAASQKDLAKPMEYVARVENGVQREHLKEILAADLQSRGNLDGFRVVSSQIVDPFDRAKAELDCVLQLTAVGRMDDAVELADEIGIIHEREYAYAAVAQQFIAQNQIAEALEFGRRVVSREARNEIVRSIDASLRPDLVSDAVAGELMDFVIDAGARGSERETEAAYSYISVALAVGGDYQNAAAVTSAIGRSWMKKLTTARVLFEQSKSMAEIDPVLFDQLTIERDRAMVDDRARRERAALSRTRSIEAKDFDDALLSLAESTAIFREDLVNALDQQNAARERLDRVIYLEIVHSLAKICILTGRFGIAARYIELIPEQLARPLRISLAIALSQRGEADQLRKHLLFVEDALEWDASESDVSRATAVACAVAALCAKPKKVVRHWENMPRQRASWSGPSDVLLLCHLARALVSDRNRATEIADLASDVASTISDPQDHIEAALAICLLRARSGDEKGAQEFIEPCVSQAAEIADEKTRAIELTQIAMVALSVGAPEVANHIVCGVLSTTYWYVALQVAIRLDSSVRDLIVDAAAHFGAL